MDMLDEHIQASFRQWDEQRLRLRAFKAQLRSCKEQVPSPELDRLASELRHLEDQYDVTFEHLLDLMRKLRPPG